MSTTPKRKKPTAAAIVGLFNALTIKPKKKTNGWKTVAVVDTKGKFTAKYLPDSNRAVLCMTRSGTQQMGYFVGYTKGASTLWESVTGETLDVTHWREL